MHELLVRPGRRRQIDVLFDQVDLEVELVHSDPVAQIAVQAIGLLSQQHQPPWVLPDEGDQLAESGTAGLLRGLDVDELVQDAQVPLKRMLPQQIELRRDGKAFLSPGLSRTHVRR